MNLITKKLKLAKEAFTLFEVLVTISILTILTAITYVQFEFRSKASYVDEGIGMIFSMARTARAQAIMNRVPSILLINFDANDPDNFLRELGIVIENPDPVAGGWLAVDRGIILPKGVYVVPRSKVDFETSWTTNSGNKPMSEYKYNSSDFVDSGVFCVEYPVPDPVALFQSGDSKCTADSTEWIGIRFAPNGRIDGGSLSNYLAIGNAQISGSQLVFSDSSSVQAVGFKLSGTTFLRTEIDLL